MDVSDSFGVTAVPFLVITRNNQVLETVSGSDATKVRVAIEKHANASPEQVDATVSSPPPPPASNTTVNAAKLDAVPQDSAEAPAAMSKDDLHQRLSTLVKAAPVMLFMKGTPSAPQCGFSRQIVALLRERTVKYGFFNILADDEVRQGLKEFADWPTFPQLWVDGELVGGLDIVRHSITLPIASDWRCRSRRKLLMIRTSSKLTVSRRKRPRPPELLRYPSFPLECIMTFRHRTACLAIYDEELYDDVECTFANYS